MSTALVPLSYQPRAAHAGRVHIVTDRFSLANTYIINDGELVIVDPASPQQVQAIISYVRYFLQRDETDIGLIVLTHFHRGQVAGAFALQERTGARIAASEAARAMPGSRRSLLRQALVSRLRRAVSRALPGSFQPLELFPRHYKALCARVDYWLLDDDGMPGHPYWKVLAAPGYAPESLCLYNMLSGELLSGEMLTTTRRSAVRTRPIHDSHTLQLAFARLRRLPVRCLVPGRGRPLLAASPLALLL